jgi:ubiquitin-protein ligase
MWTITDKTTIICVRFPEEYPISAPFIWIAKTTKNINSAFKLTKEGILMDQIAPSQGNSSIKIYNVIKQIYEMLNELQNGIEKIYSEEEAFCEYNGMVKKLNLV